MQFQLIWKETVLCAVILCLLTYILLGKLKDGRQQRRILWTLFTAYTVFLVAFTFFPIFRLSKPLQIRDVIESVVLTPFTPLVQSFKLSIEYLSIGDYEPFYIFLYNTIGNFILLMPLSFFCHTLFRVNYTANLFICLFCSLSIEILQGVLNLYSGIYHRVVDINDVILNTVGAAFLILIIWIIDSIIFFFRTKARHQLKRHR